VILLGAVAVVRECARLRWSKKAFNMTFNEPEACGIKLYVPENVFRSLNQEQPSLQLLQSEIPELSFLAPGWWETSHTCWYGALLPDPPRDS
jgi:hypothetical protein